MSAIIKTNDCITCEDALPPRPQSPRRFGTAFSRRDTTLKLSDLSDTCTCVRCKCLGGANAFLQWIHNLDRYNGLDALVEGFRRLVQYWPVLLVAYGVNLLSAAVLAIFPALGLFQAAYRPALAEAAQGISARMVVDFLGAGITNATLGINPDGRALQLALLWALVAAVLLPFLAWLPGAFLSGGVVLTYVESPAPWLPRRFLWACWHWFGPFLLLGLGQVIAPALIAVPAALSVAVSWQAAPWEAWIVAAVVAADLAVSLALFEVAGVWMVSHTSRHLGRALREAFRFLVRNAGPLVVVYGVALGGLGLAHALYDLGLWPHVPLAVWPVVLVVQQAFILTRLAARLLRLSACAVLTAQHASRSTPSA